MRCPRCGSHLFKEDESGLTYFECGFMLRHGEEVPDRTRPVACKVIALLRAQRDELEETLAHFEAECARLRLQVSSLGGK